MKPLSARNVTKVYGEDTVALDNISFDVPEGQFVVVLGPSGAGKSTLLRIINGLTEPTDGKIMVGDEEIRGTRSDVAMVFQRHYLVESMSAYRNALTGALSRTGTVNSILTRYSRRDKQLALDALETVGLFDEAEQRADSMSGGQQQRVGIARALVQDPSLLLADEPVASLDPKSAEQVMGYMKAAAEEHDLTTIASLHQVNIAREFGDRFIGINDGKIVFDGTRDELTMDDVDEIYYGEGESGIAYSNEQDAETSEKVAADGDSSSDKGTEMV